ncbi:glycosyltransferase family 4 protein [Turicibacter sanguinis]|uniref:glycosyltransferase family 4 protein n=1 Tax=Turicibacter sanguinis TaxID=154288 RepID=UPI00189B890A|nr:glycosyltransferase family 4 protein [Turicibacter sanguinis]
MNICVVSREVYPYVKAGIGVYVYHLCRLLKNKGHQVYLITDNHEGIKSHDAFDGIEVRVVKTHELIYSEIFSNYNLFYSHNVYQTLKKLVGEVTLDIVEFSDYFGEAYFTLLEKKIHGFLRETPIIIKCHTPLYECLLAAHRSTEGLEDIIVQEDFCIQNADTLCAISHTLANQIKSRLSLVKPMEVLLNPLGLNEVKLSQYSCDQPKTILYVGKLQYLKGTDLLVQAAVENLKDGLDFKVVLIGQDIDNHQQSLIDMIPKEWQSNFEFLGFATRDEVLQAFNKAYVSIFPSRWEGLSNVCIEAVTNGCPLILSDAGGLKELKNFGDFGLYFPSENLECLTKQLKIILEQESLREKYSENCNKQASVFLNEQIYEKLISFYQEAKKNLYEVKGYRQIRDILYDNFNHSKQLNIELHTEVLRLNRELEALCEQSRSLVSENQILRKQIDLKNENIQNIKSILILPYGSHRLKKRRI